jgi:bacteriocin-like protein
MTNGNRILSGAHNDLELTDEQLENVSGGLRKSGDPEDGGNVIKSGDPEDGGNVIGRLPT